MFLSTFILYLCISSSVGYKILVMCPAPTRSHHNLCTGISSILTERGHEVTFVGSFPNEKNTVSREIVLQEIREISKTTMNDPFKYLNMSMVDTIRTINLFFQRMTDAMFENEQLKMLYKDKNETFDAYILDYISNSDLLGFGVRFNCPTIALSSLSQMTWLTTLTDNPISHAIVPNVFLPYSSHMNLWHRIVNTLFTVLQDMMGEFYLAKSQEKRYAKYFPEEARKVPFYELKYQIASTLINSHPSIGIVRPLLPNSVEIGGYHINEPEALPDDIKNILDKSKHGAIYFSMGSNLKSANMSPELKNILLKTFASIKETILWKFEEELPEKPENIIIKEWLPQTGILNHPNVKLFISHGGLLSCTEAIYFGKPMLIIPVFGDQQHNAIEVTNRGQGLSLKFENLTELSLQWALNEILNNKNYTSKTKKLRKLFFDRPVNPRSLAAFQIEHVIRTKGAAHLSPPRLPRSSQMLFDVVIVLLICILLVFYIVIVCCRRYVCRKRKENPEEKLKNL